MSGEEICDSRKLLNGARLGLGLIRPDPRHQGLPGHRKINKNKLILRRLK